MDRYIHYAVKCSFTFVDVRVIKNSAFNIGHESLDVVPSAGFRVAMYDVSCPEAISESDESVEKLKFCDEGAMLMIRRTWGWRSM